MLSLLSQNKIFHLNFGSPNPNFTYSESAICALDSIATFLAHFYHFTSSAFSNYPIKTSPQLFLFQLHLYHSLCTFHQVWSVQNWPYFTPQLVEGKHCFWAHFFHLCLLFIYFSCNNRTKIKSMQSQ